MDNIFNLDDEEPSAQSYDNISRLRPAFQWLDELNSEQRAAVTTTEGPLLVLSGAGTGKTKGVIIATLFIILPKKAALNFYSKNQKQP